MKVRDIFKHPWVIEFEKKYFEQKMKRQKEEESNFSLLGLNKDDDNKEDSIIQKNDSTIIKESQLKNININENIHNDFSIFHENVEEENDMKKNNKIVVNNKKDPIPDKPKENILEDIQSNNQETIKFQSEKDKALQDIQLCKQKENRVKSIAQNININIDAKKKVKESKIENQIEDNNQVIKDYDTKSANIDIQRDKSKDKLRSKEKKHSEILSHNNSIDIALKENKLDNSDFLAENKNSDNLFDNVLLQVEKKNKGMQNFNNSR